MWRCRKATNQGTNTGIRDGEPCMQPETLKEVKCGVTTCPHRVSHDVSKKKKGGKIKHVALSMKLGSACNTLHERSLLFA